MRVRVNIWVGCAAGLVANGGLDTAGGSIYDKKGLKVSFKIIDDWTEGASALAGMGGVSYSALVAAEGRREFVAVPEVVKPIDTTAAGDSFNAAYLAARLNGEAPVAAAQAAHALAAEKIRHRGAIMPRAAAAMH